MKYHGNDKYKFYTNIRPLIIDQIPLGHERFYRQVVLTSVLLPIYTTLRDQLIEDVEDPAPKRKGQGLSQPVQSGGGS